MKVVPSSRSRQPWLSFGQESGELRLKYAELVVPWISHNPEVEPPFLLMIPAGSAEGFQSPHLSLYIVGFQVEMHALLGDLFVIGLLQEDTNLAKPGPRSLLVPLSRR
jgi:hypothetical protein